MALAGGGAAGAVSGALSLPQRCEHCGGEDIVLDAHTADVVCRGCGSVLGERVMDSSGPDWREMDDTAVATMSSGDDGLAAVAARDRRSRVGERINTLLDDGGLRTLLRGPRPTLAAGRDHGGGKGKGSGDNRYRLHMTARRGADADLEEHRLSEGYAHVGRLCTLLQVSDATGSAARFLFKRGDTYGVRATGRKDHDIALAAVVVYLAAKQAQQPRSIAEVLRVAQCKKKAFGRMLRAVNAKVPDLPTQVLQPEQLMHRYCGMVDLPAPVAQAGQDAVQIAHNVGLGTAHPAQLCGGVMLLLATALELANAHPRNRDISPQEARDIVVRKHEERQERAQQEAAKHRLRRLQFSGLDHMAMEEPPALHIFGVSGTRSSAAWSTGRSKPTSSASSLSSSTSASTSTSTSFPSSASAAVVGPAPPGSSSSAVVDASPLLLSDSAGDDPGSEPSEGSVHQDAQTPVPYCETLAKLKFSDDPISIDTIARITLQSPQRIRRCAEFLLPHFFTQLLPAWLSQSFCTDCQLTNAKMLQRLRPS